jgi:hypothetical protein
MNPDPIPDYQSFLDQKSTYPESSLKASKLQKKPSTLKIEQPAIQKRNFVNFFSIFVSNIFPA